MTDEYIDKYITRYMKTKDIKEETDLISNDLLKIVSDIYVIPKRSDIEKFFNKITEKTNKSEDAYLSLRFEIERMARLHSVLNEECNYPVIGYNPVIIDINRYRKSKRESLKDSFFVKNGFFKVEGVDKNVLELSEVKDDQEKSNRQKQTQNKMQIQTQMQNRGNYKNQNVDLESEFNDKLKLALNSKINLNTNTHTNSNLNSNMNKVQSNSENIKVSLKKDVSNLVRKGDILNLIVSRKLFMFYWNIVKVLRCVPGGLE